jgi:predicted transcriptional regulator
MRKADRINGKMPQRHFTVSAETQRQMDELAAAFGMKHSQIVRQAIARWHRVEFPHQPRETT